MVENVAMHRKTGREVAELKRSSCLAMTRTFQQVCQHDAHLPTPSPDHCRVASRGLPASTPL
eukprot:6201819-Pleurochrysis_carterae.AAC.1